MQSLTDSAEKTILHTFLDEYNVKSMLEPEKEAFQEAVESIMKQIRLKEIQLNSSLKTHEQIIKQLKEFADKIQEEMATNFDYSTEFSKEDQSKVEKIISWFKKLNMLKSNNEKILQKKIHQLEQKLKHHEKQSSSSQVETYRNANQSLSKINKNLGNKIVLITQNSQGYLTEVKKQYEEKILSLERQLSNGQMARKNYQTSDVKTQTTLNQESLLQEQITALKKENIRWRKEVIEIKKQLERQKIQRIQLDRTVQKEMNSNLIELRKNLKSLQLQGLGNRKRIQEVEKQLQSERIANKQLSESLRFERQKNEKYLIQFQTSKREQYSKKESEHELIQKNKELQWKIMELEQQNGEQLKIIEEQQTKLKELVNERILLGQVESKLLAVQQTNKTLRFQMLSDQNKSRKTQKSLHDKLEELTDKLAESKASSIIEIMEEKSRQKSAEKNLKYSNRGYFQMQGLNLNQSVGSMRQNKYREPFLTERKRLKIMDKKESQEQNLSTRQVSKWRLE